MSVRIAAGPRRVSPTAIENELEALWITLPRSGGAAASASMTMRAVMANLVAARGSDEEAARASDVIGTVIGRYPCRVILVVSEPERDPPELATDVAIVCQDSDTCLRCVCCDQIRLVARGIMADNLPSLAASLWVADLPVIVWWPKPPFDRKDFLTWAKQAERVIVDSDGYTADEVRSLARFVEQSNQMGITVGDLNWGRLTPYRQLVAQLFDTPECRDHLAAIEEVRVEGHEATARLLGGWLKAQMDKSGHSLSRSRVHLVPAGAAGFSFCSLAMTCSSGDNTFAVARTNDCTLESRATAGIQTGNRVVKSECPSVDKLLIDEMTLSGRDTVFEAALKAGVLL